MRKCVFFLLILTFCDQGFIQAQTMFKPERVFDGFEVRSGWVVVVEDDVISYAGEAQKAPKSSKIKVIDLPGMTLLPGLIEGHSHLLLHPYDETSWNDQVLKESSAERAIRGANHAEASLLAGVTTIRDLGSEGAGYTDVGLKQSIEKGVIPGPRLLVAGPAIVATGSYGPKGFHDGVTVPLGAEVADGHENIIKVVRDQIGKGADFIKVYADYRWGPNGEAQPTFTEAEIRLMVETAESSGRYVVAHASTSEGMKRAVRGGVETIEHGDYGDVEVYEIMKAANVALCPTLAAGDAIMQYSGWVKDQGPTPERIIRKRRSFKEALDSGVKICFGGDVGVYPHGDNVRELELMVEYGMPPIEVLRAATSGNAEIFHLNHHLGSLREGLKADLIAVEGQPSTDISALRNIRMVMKDGQFYLENY